MLRKTRHKTLKSYINTSDRTKVQYLCYLQYFHRSLTHRRHHFYLHYIPLKPQFKLGRFTYLRILIKKKCLINNKQTAKKNNYVLLNNITDYCSFLKRYFTRFCTKSIRKPLFTGIQQKFHSQNKWKLIKLFSNYNSL